MNEERPAADHCSGTTSREDKMSKEAITKVVQRAISDAGFRRQLSTDPTGALRGFDLSADEAAALRAGDAGRLSALGVDQRMSKAFALGGASVAATRAGGNDLSASDATRGVITMKSADGANALSNADATGATGQFSNALAQGSDASRALIDDGAAGARTIIPSEPGGQLTADLDGGSSGMASAINDDPDGFLAANADSGRQVTDAHDRGDIGKAAVSAINDDPDGFLAANANADLSGRQVTDAHDRGAGVAASANAEQTRGSAGESAFLDDSESYLTKVGYDSSATESAVTDAHDRGDEAVTRIADDADTHGTSANDGGSHLSS